MNYNDIYNSFIRDIKSLEPELTDVKSKIIKEIKGKVEIYKKKLSELEVLESFEIKLDYYTTVEYFYSYKILRKKNITKLLEIAELGNEIEKLFSSLEIE